MGQHFGPLWNWIFRVLSWSIFRHLLNIDLGSAQGWAQMLWNILYSKLVGCQNTHVSLTLVRAKQHTSVPNCPYSHWLCRRCRLLVPASVSCASCVCILRSTVWSLRPPELGFPFPPGGQPFGFFFVLCKFYAKLGRQLMHQAISLMSV